MDDRAEVRNAADPEQVRRAGRKMQRREDRVRATVRSVLGSDAGRAFCWELLERAGVFRSVFDPEPTRMSHNAGRQDFGHELIALLTSADEAGYLLMEREARERKRRDDRETDAAHTPPADGGSYVS